MISPHNGLEGQRVIVADDRVSLPVTRVLSIRDFLILKFIDIDIATQKMHNRFSTVVLHSRSTVVIL